MNNLRFGLTLHHNFTPQQIDAYSGKRRESYAFSPVVRQFRNSNVGLNYLLYDNPMMQLPDSQVLDLHMHPDGKKVTISLFDAFRNSTEPLFKQIRSLPNWYRKQSFISRAVVQFINDKGIDWEKDVPKEQHILSLLALTTGIHRHALRDALYKDTPAEILSKIQNLPSIDNLHQELQEHNPDFLHLQKTEPSSVPLLQTEPVYNIILNDRAAYDLRQDLKSGPSHNVILDRHGYSNIFQKGDQGQFLTILQGKGPAPQSVKQNGDNSSFFLLHRNGTVMSEHAGNNSQFIVFVPPNDDPAVTHLVDIRRSNNSSFYIAPSASHGKLPLCVRLFGWEREWQKQDMGTHERYFHSKQLDEIVTNSSVYLPKNVKVSWLP